MMAKGILIEMKISKDYSSHFPVLAQVLELTTGPVLELGIGPFSTPYLHWMCHPTKRRLVSYESDQKYIRYMRGFRNDFHEINFIANWDDLPLVDLWDVAFIDHSPDFRRGVETKRLANNAKYLILHDSEPEHDSLYQYSEAYPYFKYRHDYKSAFPNTTILSNFVDVTKLF